VVSVNHRLNAFGFLQLADYGAEYASSVNVGMLDIVLALQWVKSNIDRFGGDPDNVTVFGQSGGGAKVNFLMAMPAAAGLFHRAVVQSADPGIANRRSPEHSRRHTAAVLSHLGLTAGSLDRLRLVQARELADAFFETYFPIGLELDGRTRWDRLTDANWDEIRRSPPPAVQARIALAVGQRYGMGAADATAQVARFMNRLEQDELGPLPDGRIIAEQPFGTRAPALSAHVPLLVGHVFNEGGGVSYFNRAREAWTDGDMRKDIAARAVPVPLTVIDALRRTYPAAAPVEIAVLATSGLAASGGTVRQATMKAALGAAPAYAYTFAWKTPVFDGRPRAFHRSDLPFVFFNTDRCAKQTGGGDEARTLAGKMADAWIAFARTGAPGHSGLPNWPAFTPDRVPVMFFDNECVVRFDHDRDARQALAAARESTRR
jgi:para-nitrobenzyl esterase